MIHAQLNWDYIVECRPTAHRTCSKAYAYSSGLRNHWSLPTTTLQYAAQLELDLEKKQPSKLNLFFNIKKTYSIGSLVPKSARAYTNHTDIVKTGKTTQEI